MLLLFSLLLLPHVGTAWSGTYQRLPVAAPHLKYPSRLLTLLEAQDACDADQHCVGFMIGADANKFTTQAAVYLLHHHPVAAPVDSRWIWYSKLGRVEYTRHVGVLQPGATLSGWSEARMLNFDEAAQQCSVIPECQGFSRRGVDLDPRAELPTLLAASSIFIYDPEHISFIKPQQLPQNLTVGDYCNQPTQLEVEAAAGRGFAGGGCDDVIPTCFNNKCGIGWVQRNPSSDPRQHIVQLPTITPSCAQIFASSASASRSAPEESLGRATDSSDLSESVHGTAASDCDGRRACCAVAHFV